MDAHRYSPVPYARLRIAGAVDTDGKSLPARTVTVRIISEGATFLHGIRVGSDGDNVAPAGVDEVQEMIDKSAIVARTPLRMNLHYGELEEAPAVYGAGQTIVLAGRTLKGKNRVRELGERWLVKEIAAGHAHVADGALLVEACSDPRQARWIKPSGDPDFTIAAVEEEAS